MRMKFILSFVLALVVGCSDMWGQQYLTRSAEITFFSSTPIENIEAHNKQVSAIFDVSNGAIAFSVPIRAFHFKKALMEEHFNENYMETESFPSSTLKGNISGWSEASEQVYSDGNDHNVIVGGVLNIHGVVITAEFPGTIRKIYVEAGSGIIVSRGQPLFLLDPDVPPVTETEEEIYKKQLEQTTSIMQNIYPAN